VVVIYIRIETIVDVIQYDRIVGDELVYNMMMIPMDIGRDDRNDDGWEHNDDITCE